MTKERWKPEAVDGICPSPGAGKGPAAEYEGLLCEQREDPDGAGGTVSFWPTEESLIAMLLGP